MRFLFRIENYGPEKGIGDHNYCRNPTEKYDETWCYTTDPDKRWDFCVVPTCDGKHHLASKFYQSSKFVIGYLALIQMRVNTFLTD